MKIERNYEFRKMLRAVHRPCRRNHKQKTSGNVIMVKNGWRIIFAKKASPLVIESAKDLQDYFFTSMETSLLMERVESLKKAVAISKKNIILGDKNDFPEMGKELSVARSFIIKVSETQIIICGNDDRGVMEGCHYIEDLMNLSESAVMKKTDGDRREPLFSPRMIHSGWGIDQYPDFHLNALSHAGFDSILLFVEGVDKTTHGYLDFNDLIERAALYGLDVYFYSYLNSWKHPDDSDAEEYFSSVYGELFKKCPGSKGVLLAGESCEFPSKDHNTTGKKFFESFEHGVPNAKPSPGWWPCSDYPRWIGMVEKSIRKYKTDADIIFCTYNWGWAPEKERVKFLEAISPSITLMVPFEIFETIKRGNVTSAVMDYTVSVPGPGEYFVSEAKIAKKRGLKLYAESNTGGMTWDFGAVPYIPTPYQWMKRFECAHDTRKKYNVSGLMESHHYGWFPSPVSEIAKWSYWSPETDIENVLAKIAVRDFGEKAAPHALKAWRAWSDAMCYYVASNEDQYGPFRSGPSYPLIFHPNITRTLQSKEIPFPSAPYAHFGGRIIKTFYQPFENNQQTPGPIRIKAETRSLIKMLKFWAEGVCELEKAVELTPENKLTTAKKTLALGKFIHNTIRTTIHVKKWWILNQKLLAEFSVPKSIKILDQLEEIAETEIANAEDTIPVVESDSRLGWEPSMEYVTDRWHLEWKIKQVKNVLKNEIPVYRKILKI